MQTCAQPDAAPLAGAALPEASQPTEAINSEELAQRMVAAYENVRYLSFETVILQEGTKAGEEPTPPREVAWVACAMARERVRLEVHRRRASEHLLNFVDDGTEITEASVARQVIHQGREPVGRREVLLADETRFDPCLIGGVLDSWLGVDARQVQFLARVTRADRIEGREDVDGYPCLIVAARLGLAGPRSLTADHRLWIDEDRGWLRKRVTAQTAYGDTGAVRKIVTRTWLYHNIRTDPLDEHTFAPAAPFGNEDSGPPDPLVPESQPRGDARADSAGAIGPSPNVGHTRLKPGTSAVGEDK